MIFDDVPREEKFVHFSGKVSTLLNRSSTAALSTPSAVRLSTKSSSLSPSAGRSPCSKGAFVSHDAIQPVREEDDAATFAAVTERQRQKPNSPDDVMRRDSAAAQPSTLGQCITPQGRCAVSPRVSMSSAIISPSRRTTVVDDVDFDPKRFTEFPLDFPQQLEVEFDFNNGKLGVHALRSQDVLIIDRLKGEGLVPDWNRACRRRVPHGDEAAHDGQAELSIPEKNAPRLKSHSGSTFFEDDGTSVKEGRRFAPPPFLGQNCQIQEGDRILQVNDTEDVGEMVQLLHDAHQNKKDVTVTFSKRVSTFLVTLPGLNTLDRGANCPLDTMKMPPRESSKSTTDESKEDDSPPACCPLGLDYDVRDGDVYVKSVSLCGLVADWNAQNPVKGVYAGDMIEAANGVFGVKLIEAIEKWKRKPVDQLYLSITNPPSRLDD